MSTETISMPEADQPSPAKANLDAVVEAMVQYTAATSAAVFPAAAANPEGLQARIAELTAVVNTFDRSYRPGVVELIKLIDQDHIDLGHLLAPADAAFYAPFPFACAVPIRNSNGNNYKLDEPMLLIGTSSTGVYGLRSDRIHGNTPAPNRTDYRAPTPAEAREFFSKLFEGASATWDGDVAARIRSATAAGSAVDPAAAAA